MSTLILIGIPVLIILAGTLAAVTLAASGAEAKAEEATTGVEASQPEDTVSAGWDAPEPGQLAPEQIVERLEWQMRQDREAAAHFAKDPSSESLWIH